MSVEDSASWVRPDCRASSKKGGDNSQTLVRASTPGENITKRNRPASQQQNYTALQDNNNTKHDLASEIHYLRNEMSDLKTQIADMFARFESHMETVTSRVSTVETRLTTIEVNLQEFSTLKATVAILQEQVEYQAQMFLQNEVEISGLEETANENPYHIALVTAAKIGIKIADTDIDCVSCTGPRSNNENTNKNTNYPRPLVIRFMRKQTRDNFINSAKLRRNIDNKDIIENGQERKIYIIERLTKGNRLLFREARRKANEADYKYCWTKNGSIYIRKRTGDPGIRIRSYDDLSLLPYKGPDPNNLPNGTD